VQGRALVLNQIKVDPEAVADPKIPLKELAATILNSGDPAPMRSS